MRRPTSPRFGARGRVLAKHRRLLVPALMVGVAVAVISPPVRAGEPGLVEVAQQLGVDSLRVRSERELPFVVGFNHVIERREIELHGLPVRGAVQVLWGDPLGATPNEIVAARYPQFAPQLRPEDARLDLAAARAIAAGRARPDQSAAEASGELVYLLILGKPVLAWEVALPLSLARPEPSQKLLWISAVTGRVLLEEEMVQAAGEALVFPENPRATPESVGVELAGLLDVTEGAPLAGMMVNAFNCSTEELDELAPWHSEQDVEDGECYPGHRVVADALGDFTVPLPNIVFDADNKDPDDLYAELSMYFHAQKFFDHMAGLGVPEFPCETSNMLANFHYLEPAPVYPDLDYGPLNNAYFTGQCDIEKGPTMLFGQGSEADFGFDGDVVYHELGHGIVRVATAEGGLTSWRLREDGSLRDARALNEAIADYHALMITEDPYMADYVGFYWTALDKAYIRSALNENTCPANSAGQEHIDSEAFTAGLWATRERVGPKFDTVFLASLSLLLRDATLEEAVAALLQVADQQVEDGAWTADERELLFRAFEARGLVDCPRIVTDPQDVLEGTKWYLRQNSQGVDPFFPGPVQLQTVIPPESDNIILSFRIVPRGTSTGQINETPLDTRMLVRRGAGGISYEYDTVWLDQPGDEDGEIEIEEVIQVRGDWQMEVVPTALSEDERIAVVRGFEPGDVVTVTLVNLTYESQSVASEIFLTSVPASDLDGGSPFPGDEGDPWEFPGDETGSHPPATIRGDDASGSCACRSSDDDETGWAAAAAMVMLIGAARRRRRGSSAPR